MKYRKLASGFVAAAMAVGVFATPFGEVLPVIRESVVVNAGAEVYGDFEYSVSGDTAEITKYKGSASTLVIPSEIDGKKGDRYRKNGICKLYNAHRCNHTGQRDKHRRLGVFGL